MDSNKDEAERCMELAERYLREKKYDEAEKFVRKAQKLYPTKKAEGEPPNLQNPRQCSPVCGTLIDSSIHLPVRTRDHRTRHLAVLHGTPVTVSHPINNTSSYPAGSLTSSEIISFAHRRVS